MDYLKKCEERHSELELIEETLGLLGSKIKDYRYIDKIWSISDEARYERLNLEEKILELKEKESEKNGLSR